MNSRLIIPLREKHKKIASYFALFFSATGFAAIIMLCSYTGSKPVPIVPGSFVPGLWEGKYTVTDFSRQKPLYYSFTFYPDKTAVTRSKGGDGEEYYGFGKWSLTKSNTVVCITETSRGFEQKAELTFSEKGAFKTGVWSDSHWRGKFHSLYKIK